MKDYLGGFYLVHISAGTYHNLKRLRTWTRIRARFIHVSDSAGYLCGSLVIWLALCFVCVSRLTKSAMRSHIVGLDDLARPWLQVQVMASESVGSVPFELGSTNLAPVPLDRQGDDLSGRWQDSSASTRREPAPDRPRHHRRHSLHHGYVPIRPRQQLQYKIKTRSPR